MLVMHVFGNAALQAAALVWLYIDCRSNPALRSMNIFLVPLAFAALHLVGGVLCWERRRSGKTSLPSSAIVFFGIFSTLVVFAACYIEGHI